MALSLCFTRAKIFLDVEDGAERRFQGNPSMRPVPAPDWIKNTLTFKHGIADKSIVDLTPPTRKGRAALPEPEPQSAAQSFDPTSIGKNAALEPVPSTPASTVDDGADDGKPAFGGTNKPTHPKGLPQNKGK